MFDSGCEEEARVEIVSSRCLVCKASGEGERVNRQRRASSLAELGGRVSTQRYYEDSTYESLLCRTRYGTCRPKKSPAITETLGGARGLSGRKRLPRSLQSKGQEPSRLLPRHSILKGCSSRYARIETKSF